MSDLIGSRVTFAFSTHPNITGMVQHVPSATGDSFHIKGDDGVVFWVQQFDWMRVDRREQSSDE